MLILDFLKNWPSFGPIGHLSAPTRFKLHLRRKFIYYNDALDVNFRKK